MSVGATAQWRQGDHTVKIGTRVKYLRPGVQAVSRNLKNRRLLLSQDESINLRCTYHEGAYKPKLLGPFSSPVVK